MQLRTEGDRNVTTSGARETRAFSIKANGKAFRILLDGLYSDKILAIVRELCTNAYDAHLDAGNPAPFDVHVPGVWEPHFFVRDYGCSMTHEQVMGLYTTVFDSTKDDRNDAVGAFGLGSKSPFAYSDTFQVTVWKDGEQRVYNAVIGSDGTPEISLFARVPSQEPTGVMVGFPIRADDARAFRNAIKRVFLGFASPFNLLNVDKAQAEFKELLEVRPARSGKGWFLFDRDFGQAAGVSGLLARQGCVVYPIEVDKISTTASARGQAHTLKLFEADWRNSNPYTALIDFEIGELSPAANRESLAYDKDTVSAIVDRLELFGADMVKDAEKILLAQPTPLKMVQAYDALQVGNEIKALIGRTVQYRGELVSAIVNRFHYGSRHDGHSLSSRFGIAMCSVRTGASRPSFRAQQSISVDLRADPFFVVDPGTIDRATNRVATAMDEAGKRQVYWIRPSSAGAIEADFLASVRRLLDCMTEGLTYRDIASFAPKSFSKGRGTQRDYTPFRKVDLFEGSVEELEHDAEDGGVYVLMRHNRFLWAASDGSEQLLELAALTEIVNTVDAVCGTRFKNNLLIGIIGNSHSVTTKNTGWTSLQDALRNAMKVEFDRAKFETTLNKWATKLSHGSYSSPEYNVIENARWLAQNLPGTHELATIERQKEDFENVSVYTRSQILTLQRYLDLEVPEQKECEADYVVLAKRLAMKYPLLSAVTFSRTTGAAVEQYVNMIDAQSV